MSDKPFPILPAQVRADVTQICKLLSDPNRLRIFLHLAEHGEVDVTSLCELMEITQPAVSHHLSLLRIGSVIQVRRDGRHKLYSLNDSRLRSTLLAILRCADPNGREMRFDKFLLRHDGELAQSTPTDSDSSAPDSTAIR